MKPSEITAMLPAFAKLQAVSGFSLADEIHDAYWEGRPARVPIKTLAAIAVRIRDLERERNNASWSDFGPA